MKKCWFCGKKSPIGLRLSERTGETILACHACSRTMTPESAMGFVTRKGFDAAGLYGPQVERSNEAAAERLYAELAPLGWQIVALTSQCYGDAANVAEAFMRGVEEAIGTLQRNGAPEDVIEHIRDFFSEESE